jgi:hypothetical protein
MKNNQQEFRITDKDFYLIKSTFAENDELLKTLRKIFLPELDANAPVGQQIDLWMNAEVDNMSAEDALINIKARNLFIKHLEGCLVQLKVLAGKKDETIEATKDRLKRDSSK